MMSNSTAKKQFTLSHVPPFYPEEIHNRNDSHAILMLSGGMDSTVSLWWALHKYQYVKVLIIDYNQPHRMEIEHAERLAKLTGVNYRTIKVDLPLDYWGLQNYLTRGQAGFMTSLAALDIGHEGADIILGILKTDVYGDCDRNHLDAMADVLFHNDDWGKIGIATPLRAWPTKTDVLASGYRMGAPVSYSWSCRRPVDGEPCNHCMQCKERLNAISAITQEYHLDWDSVEAWQNVLGSPYHPSFKALPDDVYVLTEAFIQAGGMRRTVPGWRYMGPDHVIRVSTRIRNPQGFISDDALPYGSICDIVAISGFLEDGSLWELCICEDGKVAITDNLPPADVIQQALVEWTAKD